MNVGPVTFNISSMGINVMEIATNMGAKRQHVHSCSLVRGRKYYGYYPNEQLFIKIVLYPPNWKPVHVVVFL
jgi:DNA polymerase zeta